MATDFIAGKNIVWHAIFAHLQDITDTKGLLDWERIVSTVP